MGAGIIGVLISLMVMMIIGIVVVMALVTSQGAAGHTGWSTEANATWVALQSNIWTAFTLLVIIPIIIGAVAILGYLRFGGGA
jgi:hypothetical protein